MLTQSAIPEASPSSPFAVSRSRKPAAPRSLTPAGVPMSFGRNAEIYAEGETVGLCLQGRLGRGARLQAPSRRTPPDQRLSSCRARCSASRPTTSITLRPRPWCPSRSSPSNGQGLLSAGAVDEFRARASDLTMLGLRHTQDHLLLLGRKNALERLAAFLLGDGRPLGLDARSSILPCRATTSPTISG